MTAVSKFFAHSYFHSVILLSAVSSQSLGSFLEYHKKNLFLLDLYFASFLFWQRCESVPVQFDLPEYLRIPVREAKGLLSFTLVGIAHIGIYADWLDSIEWTKRAGRTVKENNLEITHWLKIQKFKFIQLTSANMNH